MTLEPFLGNAVLVALALQRASEVVLDRVHVARIVSRGGVVVGGDGSRSLVAFHVAWFVSIVAERAVFHAHMPAAAPALALGALLALVEIARASVLATLGRRFTVRVVVIPGERPIESGPYRWLRHPNYAVVAAELVLVPLLLGAWRTALVGTVVHAPLLARRIRREDEAWGAIGAPGAGAGEMRAPATSARRSS